MKKIYQLVLSSLFVFMCVFHVYLFVSGISLSDQINGYELNIKKLQQENIELEKKLYKAESLTQAASVAASLNFTHKATPVYLQNLNIALNR